LVVEPGIRLQVGGPSGSDLRKATSESQERLGVAAQAAPDFLAQEAAESARTSRSQEQFANWLETCTQERFTLQQGNDCMVTEPSSTGITLETSDHYGPNLGGRLSQDELDSTRGFLPAQ